jgi:hypothetical protein
MKISGNARLSGSGVIKLRPIGDFPTPTIEYVDASANSITASTSQITATTDNE